MVQPIAEWLANVGLERYAPAFADNDIDVSVLPHLTDADLEKIGVSLGHRRKILAAVADTRTDPKRRETAERRQLTDMLSELVGSTALSARMRPADLSEASPVSSPLRPAEMIGGGFLRSPQAPTFSPTAADDRHDGDIQADETGEAYADCDNLPSPRWRGRLGTAVTVLCLAGLGAVGAFAYRAVLAGTELPTLPPIIKAENGVPNPGDEEMIRHSAPIQHVFFHRRLAGTISSRVPVFAPNAVRDRVLPERGLANEGASMTNDPELHPLMSLRLCTALWLGSIARHGLIEKLCRASMSRFTSLRSPDFARAS